MDIRKRINLSILFGAVMMAWILTNPFNAQAQGTGFVPVDDKVLLIVGQDKQTIEDYIYETVKIPGGFMVYTSLKNLEGLSEPANYGSGEQHAQYFVNGYPNMTVQIGLHLVGSLGGVVNGSHDINIIKLAQWIQETGRPVYLRIGYEFDLPQNKYHPETYVEAFRYIVNYFRKMQINNVAFVWHSYAGYAQNRMKWYPGDEFVDWFAISFLSPYNRGNMDFMAARAREHNKPFMIAEATPKGIGTLQGEKSWDTWYKRFFDFIERQNVKVVCYINSDWESLSMFRNRGWGNARVQDNEFVLKKWIEEVNKEKYLHASPLLFSYLH